MSCPVPHTGREKFWLVVGVATGCAITYAISNKSNFSFLKSNTTSTKKTTAKTTTKVKKSGEVSNLLIVHNNFFLDTSSY